MPDNNTSGAGLHRVESWNAQIEVVSFKYINMIYLMYPFVQEFKIAVEDENSNHKVVNTSAKELTDYCRTLPIKLDTAPIENEVRDTNTRYEKLKLVNVDAEREARVLEQNYEVYQSAIDPVKETLEELDAFLESEADIGFDVEKGKDELQRVEVKLF